MAPAREPLAAVLLLLAASLASPAAARAPQAGTERACRADYSIVARVDPAERRLEGRAVLRWTNRTRDTVPDLWFHLYWNAFANDRSTHLVESWGELRGRDLAGEWGWQRVTSIQVGGQELLPTLVWRAPDDGNAEDRTVFSVRLPEPARSEESIEVFVTWEARLPRVRRRVGIKDDFLFLAHWVPKLGVYEQANGWNCHQFHASTEFFSDYGWYDVELDLPEEYEGKVGGSGVETGSERDGRGRVRVRFQAPSLADRLTRDATGRTPLVHEFAWTADPDFVVHRGRFRFEEWAERFPDEVAQVGLALSRPREEIATRDVEIVVLLQPEHADQAERHVDATATALFFYGLWFGGYPYERVTVVDPAWGAGAAGGMEYPTLFTAGTRCLTWPGMLSPESVTVHECGHQFWYGLVGNNEFEAAWLDEGLNTFSQNEAMARRYGALSRTTDFASIPFDGVALLGEPGGAGAADWLALRRWQLPWLGPFAPLTGSGFLDAWRRQPLLSYARGRDDLLWRDRNGYLEAPDTDPIDTHGWRYADATSYRQNSYRRTAVALRSLARMVGPDRFVSGMRRFAETWRYGHPYPHDFFLAFQQGAGVDAQDYFEAAFQGTATVDWSIAVRQEREGGPRGWFQDEHGAFVEREDAEPSTEDEEAEPADGAADAEVGAARGWRQDVLVRRRGTLLLPLDVEIAWADGARERFRWPREVQERSAWWRPLGERPSRPARIVSAVVDPDHVYFFDTDLSNNAWYHRTESRTALRWSERVLAQAVHLLHWIGGLGG